MENKRGTDQAGLTSARVNIPSKGSVAQCHLNPCQGISGALVLRRGASTELTTAPLSSSTGQGHH
ncbi:UNVERIFIED_CONTAM: hypothetical protein FKN15_019709 [Acipenser sinensis]